MKNQPLNGSFQRDAENAEENAEKAGNLNGVRSLSAAAINRGSRALIGAEAAEESNLLQAETTGVRR